MPPDPSGRTTVKPANVAPLVNGVAPGRCDVERCGMWVAPDAGSEWWQHVASCAGWPGDLARTCTICSAPAVLASTSRYIPSRGASSNVGLDEPIPAWGTNI